MTVQVDASSSSLDTETSALRDGDTKRDEEFPGSAAVLQVLEHERRLHASSGEDEPGHVCDTMVRIWRITLGRWGEDWIFLALLGSIMALVSYAMDELVALSFTFRLWLFKLANVHVALQYLAWVSVPVVAMVLASMLVGFTAPQAAGSGLPELKAILRGAVLDGYFGFRTLIAKFVGITCTLGTGMPLGREGSLIHMSAMIAAMLGRVVGSLNTMAQKLDDVVSEMKNADLLAAACAVGVATTFASPIGGVLFSIEVTSVYFAVRNYWRGFFAAVFGAAVFRLLAVWFSREDTVVAIYLTNFSTDFPFDPQELFAYALVGVISGFGAALYVWMHRKCVTFVRTNPIVQRFIYLFVGVTVLSTVSLTFPAGIGQYMAGDLYTVDQVKCLFKNYSFAKTNLTKDETEVLSHWNVDQYGVFTSLGIYIVFTWLFSIWCSSMPVPLGNFGPVFKMGAAVGRFVGELTLLYFPRGVTYGDIHDNIIPGSYATVGAAAFSGAVTHTVSTAVIVFEMTGQVTHTFPIMIAVLIANGICTLLQPSIYDSLILIKQLPYLPHLYPKAGAYRTFAKDFMVRTVRYIWHGMTYGELLELLNKHENIDSFPLVNSPEDMILVGSVRREQLSRLLEHHLGDERRRLVAAERSAELHDSRAAKEAQGTLRHNRSLHEEMGGEGIQMRVPRVFVSMENLPREGGSDMMALVPLSLSRQADESVVCTIPSGDVSRSLRHSASWRAIPMPPPPSLHQQARAACSSSLEAPYHTVHGERTPESSAGRIAFCEALRRSSSSASVSGPFSLRVSDNPEGAEEETSKTLHTLHESLEAVDLAAPLVVDMAPEERRRWEAAELRRAAALGACQVDPAPFHLVVSTPLARAHSLFCLLGVRRAYVTLVGRLVGVVSLPELRRATENSNAGILPPKTKVNGADHSMVNHGFQKNE